MRDAFSFLLDNISIRFGTKLYRKSVGILMGTNWTPLVADCFYSATKKILMNAIAGDYCCRLHR